MAGRLEGKIAVITGASRGLGQYVAVGYAREGAKVVIAARTEEVKDDRLPGTIYETARLVKEAGSEALPVVCNVADMAAVEAMIKQAMDHFGRIDILMTNAAVQPPGGISTIQPRHWELEFKVNVNGPFYCIRACLPIMQAQKSGNIINISSVAAKRGSHYGATKRAVESMTIGLAQELKDDNIVVNALAPVGAIATPGFLFAHPDGRRTNAAEGGLELDPPVPGDSYVEAAVLMAMQTVDSCTGQVYNDAEAIIALAGDAEFQKYKAMNPPTWSKGL